MARSPRNVVVHKFGGAALADASAIARVVALLAGEPAPDGRIVVTSALHGVTNALIAAVRHATRGDRESAAVTAIELYARHQEVAWNLLGDLAHQVGPSIDAAFEELRPRWVRLAVDRDRAPAESDAALALGERLAARLVCAALLARGVDATVIDGAALIRTDERHGNAAPDLERTDAIAPGVLAPLLDRGATVVVPGFIGAGANGDVVTLGRGGSDLSATVIARAVGAREVTLWKDVAGFMTADPRLLPTARVVPTLDPREASELAYYGAKVLHPRTLVPLRDGMRLRVRPFADPAASGTTIIAGRVAGGAPVRAISGLGAQALVAVTGTGMLGVPGVAARVFRALAKRGVSASMISQASSEQSICFTIPADRAPEVEEALRTAFAGELSRREVDDVTVRAPLATIAVVGSGMARTPGISARIFGAVAGASVNVVAIAQGASERNVSFVVEERDAAAAMSAVHREFRLDKVGGGRAQPRRAATDIILLGLGRVSRQLVAQYRALAGRGLPLRIVGVIDSRGFVFRARGLADRQLEALVVRKERGETLDTQPDGERATAAAAVEFMAAHALSRPVLVDLASGDTSVALLHALGSGMDLVLANKSPLAGDLATARRILDDARAAGRRVLHEATVGAGLPVIDTLQQLRASGDRIDSVDSSPSGTMGFLFSEIGRGRPFSAAVYDAMDRGYTEPDPRDDLCGLDVGRKGIILARMLGYTGEMSDVRVESLVPTQLRDVTRQQFLDALPACDAEWSARAAAAHDRNEVLRYRVRATRAGVKAGLVAAPGGSPLASLDGTDNLFVFTTARYRGRPLVVSGPGAGAEVTAAGVLGDVLRLATA